MLAKNTLAILAIVASALALPCDTPYYSSPIGSDVTTSAPSYSPTRVGNEHHGSVSTASAVPLLSSIVSSGSDGEGNQNVGNLGQGADSGATHSGTTNGSYTVQQATTTCGNAQLNCCNKVSREGDTNNAGLLGSVFGSGDLDIQCSPIDIPIIGIQVPMNKACNAKAACCQGDTTQNGLVNVGCIAIASFI